jgi:hypothetical protein
MHAVAALTGPAGSPHFDARTKTHTVEQLLAALPPAQLAAHVAGLRAAALAAAHSDASSSSTVPADDAAATSVHMRPQGGRAICVLTVVSATAPMRCGLPFSLCVCLAPRLGLAALPHTLDALVGLLRNARLPRHRDWMEPAVAFFLVHGLCEPSTTSAPAPAPKGKAARAATSTVAALPAAIQHEVRRAFL